MSDVTRILPQIESGDPSAAEHLLPIVYDELRKMAAAKLAQENPGLTLQATALVHEAYLRLIGKDNLATFENQRHFFAAAAEAMRRILVDQARRKLSVRHGGERQRIPKLPATPDVAQNVDQPLAVDELILGQTWIIREIFRIRLGLSGKFSHDVRGSLFFMNLRCVGEQNRSL